MRVSKRIELCEGSWAEIYDGRLRGAHKSEMQGYMGRATTIENGKIDQTQFGPIMSRAANEFVRIMVEKWHLTYAPDADAPFRNPDWLQVIDAEDLELLVEATQPQFDKIMLSRKGREPEQDKLTGQPSGPTPLVVEPSPPSEAETSARHSATTTEPGTEPSSTPSGSNAGA